VSYNNWSSIPTIWTGLPTVNPPPGVSPYPDSYINGSPSGWTLSGPTYGNFGGLHYPSGPIDISQPGKNILDEAFKLHDIDYQNAQNGADYHAADLALIGRLQQIIGDPSLLSQLHFADAMYAYAALGLFEAKAFLYNHTQDLFASPLSRFLGDPLVLDLDGDGVELSTLGGSTVHFDFAGDGFAELTGWISADDGILAIDDSNNGLVDNGLELFGSSTQDGFAVLEKLDTNDDGKIDFQDADFGKLRVWRDLNQNGVSESGELQSLSQAGISSISLNRQHINGTNAGHTVGYEALFTRTDAITGTAQTVYFQTDRQDSIADNTPTFTPAEGVTFLPQLDGSGTIHSIAYKATTDAAFRAAWTPSEGPSRARARRHLHRADDAAALRHIGRKRNARSG